MNGDGGSGSAVSPGCWGDVGVELVSDGRPIGQDEGGCGPDADADTEECDRPRLVVAGVEMTPE